MKAHLKFINAFIFLLLPISLFAHGVSPTDQALLNSGGLFSYIYVGAKHMLTGYDHLLFLVGVVFYLKGFKDVIKFITLFTIGHCITLTGASFLGITANEHLVDAVIALSVLYKGFENLGGFKKLKLKAPNLSFMIFTFGLIHGFGLATRFQSFEVGEENFLLKILSFNLGVEIGQILALIPIVFMISYWKKYKSYTAFYKATNTYLILIGIALFVYQLYGYFTTHQH